MWLIFGQSSKACIISYGTVVWTWLRCHQVHFFCLLTNIIVMRIGLLLGSFDPIHIGHINMASCVLNNKACDKVLFVVAKHNPWKDDEPVPFEIRCQMVEAAIKPFGDKCEVCKIEEEITPPVFSYCTIGKALEEFSHDELFLIGGTDTIHSLPHWKNYDTHIKDKIKLIEIARGETNLEERKKHIYFVTHRMDISSTMIRNILSKGLYPIPYIPSEVWSIIKEHKLYG